MVRIEAVSMSRIGARRQQLDLEGHVVRTRALEVRRSRSGLNGVRCGLNRSFFGWEPCPCGGEFSLLRVQSGGEERLPRLIIGALGDRFFRGSNRSFESGDRGCGCFQLPLRLEQLLVFSSSVLWVRVAVTRARCRGRPAEEEAGSSPAVRSVQFAPREQPNFQAAECHNRLLACRSRRRDQHAAT